MKWSDMAVRRICGAYAAHCSVSNQTKIKFYKEKLKQALHLQRFVCKLLKKIKRGKRNGKIDKRD